MISTTNLSLPNRGRYKNEIDERVRYARAVVGFTLVHALSADEHEHNPARMRYSKFVHNVQNYRQTVHRCCLLAALFVL